MITVELIQGTPEWHAHRASHFNASDAPAMMGCSPYKTRSQLVREFATGATIEHDAATLQRFADGHRFEDLARPLAERIIGEELYPCVGVDGKFSASFDGLTLLEDTAFEHKSLNDDLRLAMPLDGTDACLPLHYQVQMEHQAMVSGAERVLFMASKWAGDELVEERHCWYTPNPELRARIVAGWAQFDADVLAYDPAPVAEPVAPGRAPDQMPALRIEVTGMVTASNLAEWKEQAIAVFQGISTELVSDQDFADAEKTVKWCGDIEDQLKAAKQHALSQTQSIDLLFKTIDAIAEEARSKRLALEKRVKTRKDERRTEIGNAARRAVQQHVLAINETLGEHAIPMPAQLIADIGDAMKGKRSFASMQEAVDAVAANAKVDASQSAERIRANIRVMEMEVGTHAALFPDRVQLCSTKSAEDLRNLMAARISQHQQAEQDRLDAEREKIRKEEEERAQKAAAAEQAAQAAQTAAAQQQTEPVAAAPAATAVPVRTAPTAVTSAPAPNAAPREVVKIKLGDINARIAPLSISADGLALLGFKPINATGAAKLYDQAQFPDMCRAMIHGLQDAADQYPLAA
ncbi:TPA: YqaJ viral recombinase family protein [Stenotrophomonas maltophilia]|uniref:YqaJ viral recombinase family protein n=1 Tax=Stenotrophomonas sp. GD03680 TaxID=2975365 RepID=UPI002448373D|nr:YqaJ viral recombinase family protein [Stenotrophomonas sp. GD03680]MDH2022537.1 YqaJ viral recombinase family protein [Stenotrophomonas sp. GD03680]HEL3748660.1 YqaJ viral recombinase family protein [Stenotrophomonas maltophilia]HEL7729590.1 YqaJ viral recombinase family protein [Stenotrophomonas maltophilia]